MAADERPLPRVSVIIPTYNRAMTLAGILDDLMAQEYPADRLEIVVADDASTDATEQVVQAAQRRSPFPLLYVRCARGGPAVARNRGVARATGEVLAFTDSDCRVPPTWVCNGVRRMEPGVGLVWGPLTPVVNPDRRPGFFCHQNPLHDDRNWNQVYPTANVLYLRKAFDEVGGFDESFGTYPWGLPKGGEDTDLAWRVKRAGYAAAFAADAPVYHEATDVGVLAWLIEPIKSFNGPRMVRDIPELREGFWRRYIVEPHTPPFYLAVLGAGLALTRRRPLALALTLPWFWTTYTLVRSDMWPPARWWRLPVKEALLAIRWSIHTAALIAGSIRYRRLLL
jgi:glycosyltransferase involved in cell wall biosynthesis